MKKYFPIAIITLIGFALRAWGLNFGLPYILHQDEPIVVNHALAYGTGGLNPHFFIIPPLCSYLVFIAYGAYYALGSIFGVFSGIDDFALKFFSDPTRFYFIARVVLGLLPGTMIVPLVYVLYKRLFPQKGALYAASVAAFCFLFVVNSHYAYVDNWMVVFMLFSFIFFTKITEQGLLIHYITAGFFIGLAISAKYNSGLLFIPLYLAHVGSVRSSGRSGREYFLSRPLFASILAAAFSFMITNPFCVLDAQFFAESVFFKIRGEYTGLFHHVSYSLSEGMGFLLLLISFAGVILIFARERLLKSLIIFLFPVVFYAHLVLRSQQFSRYALPLIPFLAIAAAYFIFAALPGDQKNRAWFMLAFVLSAFLLLPTAVKSVKADMLFCAEDTRITAARWIEENIPAGEKIAFDHTSFSPQVRQSAEQLSEKYGLASRDSRLKTAKERKLDYVLRSVRGKKTYNIFFMTPHERKGNDYFLSEYPNIKCDIGELVRSGVRYVVINYNTQNGEMDENLKEIIEKSEKIAEFSPYIRREIRPLYDVVDKTYMSIGTAELFSRKKTGPCFVIYKLKY